MKIRGIGKSMKVDIDQYFDMGYIERKEPETEKEKVLTLFNGIYDVGPKKALSFYNQGYKTLSELRKNKKLTKIRLESEKEKELFKR